MHTFESDCDIATKYTLKIDKIYLKTQHTNIISYSKSTIEERFAFKSNSS